MNIRIKRPQGLTYQIKALKTIKEEKEYKREKDRIINRVINDYIQDGFRLNQKPATLTNLADYIGESLISTMRRMNKLGEYMLGNQNQAFKALLANTINHLATTKALALDQFGTLRISQSGGYVPFVSSAVNEALRGLISTDANLISLLRIMAPTQNHNASQTNIQITNQPVGLQNTNLLNVNDAVKLIDQNREVPLLESSAKIDALETKYIEEGTPQILATKQKGLSTDGLKPRKKLKVHELRREDDGEILES